MNKIWEMDLERINKIEIMLIIDRLAENSLE
jgi:hypothetical protein